MDRLFLDANILFSAAYRDGAGVARLWKLDDVVLLTSGYAIEETRRNLSGPDRMVRLEGLLAVVQHVPDARLDARSREGIHLRDKDWPILAAAVNSGATHLITGDRRDFGPYFGHDVLGVRVLPPRRYLREREGG